MSLIDYRELDDLRNRNEEPVWAALEAFFAAHPELCRCRDCVLDTAAITLNRLPPRYQVYPFHGSDPGADEARERQIAEAVRAASALVSMRPHHF